MTLLVVLSLTSVALGGMDYEMVQKWQKLKAMESCWGEDNMKIYTVNMKKAVAKCQQQDAPELDLPPFRAINRLINNMVGMAGYKEDEHHEMKYFMKFYRYMQMMKMMNHDDDDHHQENYGQYPKKPMQYTQMKDSSSDMNMMEKMKMMLMMKKMMDNKKDYNEDYGNMDMQNYRRHDDLYKNMGYQNKRQNEDSLINNMDSLDSMFRKLGKMRFKRQADDSLALNDRLKEKLEHMMKEHVEHVSNMTCVLREMKVIDQNNNIDVRAMKKDAEQYKLPSAWFGDRYEEILDSCYEVAENLPAGLQDKVLPNNYNGPMRNLGKIKSFMNCCKSAKMKLCMYQDTKKKIETNFGPVDQLLEGFNNQITEEQVFYMVNELLQGDDDEFM
jgi:hypothetical protein